MRKHPSRLLAALALVLALAFADVVDVVVMVVEACGRVERGMMEDEVNEEREGEDGGDVLMGEDGQGGDGGSGGAAKG